MAAVVAALSSNGESTGAHLLVAAAALGWYVWLRARGANATPAIISLVAGVAALVAECGILPEHLLCMTGAVSSGLLIGAVSVSMLLGHWYLVDTSLSIASLNQGAMAYGITVAFRATHVAFALGGGGWEKLKLSGAEDDSNLDWSSGARGGLQPAHRFELGLKCAFPKTNPEQRSHRYHRECRNARRSRD